MGSPELWTDLGEDDPVILIDRPNASLGVGLARESWDRVCEWASRSHPGQWIPKDRGLTWGCGSRYWWCVEPEQVEGIGRARAICETLGLSPGWSIGSCARQLLRYCGKPQYPERQTYQLMHEVQYGYQECHPGWLDSADKFDVSSYYFDLWRRLPCLRISLHSSGRLIWHREESAERRRREEVSDLVVDLKPLRNALWGCSLGRARGTVYYHQGERKVSPALPGPFMPAAVVLARSAYELTYLASVECESHYSNVDCVVTTGGLYPGIWERKGFRVKHEASGPAEICGLGIYSVGLFATKWYSLGSRFRDPFPRPDPPDRYYHRSWVA